MSDDHSARAGSLHAHLTTVAMEIDDDDEDIIMVVVDVVNESAIPVGGLEATVVSDKGQRYAPVEGISSIGPGLTRQFKFEAGISSGTWMFEFMGGGQKMTIGPYDADFEFQAEKDERLEMQSGRRCLAEPLIPISLPSATPKSAASSIQIPL